MSAFEGLTQIKVVTAAKEASAVIAQPCQGLRVNANKRL
jgi:hypothetical protein